jgi:hypothetical protein
MNVEFRPTHRLRIGKNPSLPSSNARGIEMPIDQDGIAHSRDGITEYQVMPSGQYVRLTPGKPWFGKPHRRAVIQQRRRVRLLSLATF